MAESWNRLKTSDVFSSFIVCSTQNRSALVRELLSNSSLFVSQLYKAKLLVCCNRHLIKIPFIDKGIEFIDLHNNFKENLVISSFPNYFNNSETPIICYKYNKPIRSTIFNFNKIATDIDIDSNTHDS